MRVIRIVPNIATDRVEEARAFYGGILGLRVAMDQGWIMTFAGEAPPDGAAPAPPQVSVAREGGGGTPVPDLSIEVDDLAEVRRRIAAAGMALAYGPVVEPWGVERLFVRDPFGRLVNILSHARPA